MNSPYELLKAHVAKHKYTRGKNKGDAPLDPKRRRRDHERVSNRGDCMVVHMYYTDVLTAYPDGRVVVNCSGWGTSPTTRIAVTQGLHLMGIRASMGSVRYRNLSQAVIHLPVGSFRYYDGMMLVQDAGKWVVQDLKPFRAKVRDTERVGAWDEAVKASGFKNLFPILHMNAEREHMPTGYWDGQRMMGILSSAEQSEHWLAVVAAFKWDYKYTYAPGGATKEWFALTRRETWTKLRSTLTKGMYKTIDTTDTCF
jgi:hypothetical protein